MIAVANLAESVGADIRVTRLQNFVVANVPEAEADDVVSELAAIGFPLDVNPVRGRSIACTGEPHCNFSVTETKTRLGRLIEGLEERFGDRIAELHLNLDGCPHSCAQHWVGDLGFQGTTARDAEGVRRQAYDIFVRGGLGLDAAIGRPLFRRIPTEELDQAVEGLVDGWLEGRRPAESFAAFATRLSDDELGALAGVEPARKRERGDGRGSGSGGRLMAIELIDELEAGELSVEFEGEEPDVVLGWAIEHFSPRIAISTAFQIDGIAVLDMAYEIDPEIRVFSVDTGRMPQESFDLIERLRDRYPGLNLELLSPNPVHLQRMVARKGPNLFYESVENRLLCCNVRKVQPLTRHLATLDAWITGLRRDQWATRTNIRKVEIDHDHGAIVKLNPLAEWTEDEVWDYVRERELPYNTLYDQGYTSIGCAPCTRAVAPGEQSRAGRWWWESNAPKECGIHCAIETGGFEHELHALLSEDEHE